MNVKPLFVEGKIEAVAYLCGKCRNVAKEEAVAEDCCVKLLCGCGEEASLYLRYSRKELLYCQCGDTKNLVEFKRKVSLCDVVEVPTVGLVSDGFGEFFKLSDIDAVFKDRDLPLFVFDCDDDRWQLDVTQFIEHSFERDSFNLTANDVIDKQELTDFITDWNLKQTISETGCDMKRIIILKPDEFRAWLLEK